MVPQFTLMKTINDEYWLTKAKLRFPETHRPQRLIHLNSANVRSARRLDMCDISYGAALSSAGTLRALYRFL